MNINVDEIIKRIKNGALSETEEIMALAGLHRQIAAAGGNRGMLLAAPVWRREAAETGVNTRFDSLIAIDMSAAGAEKFDLESIKSGLNTRDHIVIRKDEGFYKNLYYSADPDARIEAGGKLEVIRNQRARTICVLLLENAAADDTAGNSLPVFMGRLLFCFALLKALAANNISADIRVATLATGGGYLSLAGAVSGLLKTLVVENRHYSAKTIWLRDPGVPGGQVVRELQSMPAGSHTEVALGHELREIRRFVEAAPVAEKAGAAPVFQAGKVVLISGGLGGLGSLLASRLCKNHGLDVVVCGRSPVEKLNAAQREYLAFNPKVHYVKADISVGGEVRTLLEGILVRYQRLDGIIHAAGLLRDGWLQGKSLASIKAVLAPKIAGAFWLDFHSRDLPLRHFIQFSSIAALAGSPGQGDYACANAFLDYFCGAREALRQRDERGGKTFSINWPLWEEGGMRPAAGVTDQVRRATGLQPLPSRDGVQSLIDILGREAGQYLVLHGDTDSIRNSLLGGADNVCTEPADTRNGEAENQNTDFDREGRAIALTDSLKELIAQTLKLDLRDIQPEDDFSSYGFDSISLTELSRKITSRYAFITLEPAVFLEYPTLAELSDFILRRYATQFTPPGEVAQVEVEEPALPARPVRKPETEVEAIAIIGMGGRFPGAGNITAFWENLLHSRTCIERIPVARWNWRDYDGDPDTEPGKTDCHFGAFMADIDCFDSLHFDISPREAELMDPQQRLLLEAGWETFEHAGYSKAQLLNARVGLFIGIEKHDYLQVIAAAGCSVEGYINTGNAHAILANRVSWFFGLRGTSVTLNTACSSSFSAIHSAINSIQAGQCDMALAGGCNILLSPELFVLNRKMGMLTGDDRVRPFDKQASGHLFGEGLGLVLFKRLSQAERDGDVIYGVIKGMNVEHGGKGVFLTAPNAESHLGLIRRTLDQAGLSAKHIDYIEAQGTGDQLTDIIELKTYHKIFAGVSGPARAIGTVKGHTGHLGAASGVVALIKAILSLKNNRLIGVLNHDSLNWKPEDGDFACEVLRCNTPWPPKSENGIAAPRLVALHNFGYGGVNGHLLLQEYLSPPVSAGPVKGAGRVLVFSARTEQHLETLLERFCRYLELRYYKYYGFSEVRLEQIAYTLQVGRTPMAVRLAFVVESVAQVVDTLRRFLRGAPVSGKLYRGEAELEKSTSSAAQLNCGSDAGLENIAAYWAAGGVVDWQALYGEAIPGKVALPTYPFSRIRHWVDTKKAAHGGAGKTAGPVGETARIHPLLHRNTSVFNAVRFSSVFNGEEFFLRDHSVDNRKVLPGVACLEMARTAVDTAFEIGSRSEGGRVTRLENIIWTHPVVVDDAALTVHIRLALREDQAVNFEVYTVDEKNGCTRHHCQGLARWHSAQMQQADIATLRKKMNRGVLESDSVYQSFKTIGFEYGAGHRAIEALYLGNGEVLAKLRLPPALTHTQEDYVLHPSLLDAALQATIGLSGEYKDNADSEALFIPFALEQLEWCGDCRNIQWAWVRPSMEPAGRSVRKLDIDICDGAGNICALLQGYTARLETRASPGDRERIHPLLHWYQRDASKELFHSHFDGEEFFLSDHMIDTKKVLPAAVYLEMARAAGAHLSGKPQETAIGFKNLVWSTPLVFINPGQEVRMRICRETEVPVFKVETDSTDTDSGSPTLHFQAGFLPKTLNDIGNAPAIDLAEIRKRCNNYLQPDECKRILRSTHGPGLLSISRYQYNQSEALISLSKPACFDTGFEEYIHNISYFNGAVLTSVIFSFLGDSRNDPALPFSLEKMVIYGKLPECACVYLQRAPGGERKGVNVHHLSIVDKSGCVIVSFQGFTTVSPASAVKHTSIPDSNAQPAARNEESLDALCHTLREIAAKLQKIPVESLGPDTEFSRFGFDSMGFTEFSNRINSTYGLDIMPTVFFEHTTVRSLGKHLINTYASVSGTARAEAGNPEVLRAVEPLKAPVADFVSERVPPIAVIGMSGRFPGCSNLEEFWKHLALGSDLISEIPADRWNWREYYGDPVLEEGKTNVKYGGFMPDISGFDAGFFGISAAEAGVMDPQLRILLETVWSAIEDAGLRAGSLAGTKTGVFIGVSTADYKELWQQARAAKGIVGSELFPFMIPNRISYEFDLHGPSEAIDTACSSSLIALHRAVESLRHRDCEMALTGGVNVIASPGITISASRSGMLSRDGRCKTFDRCADGYGRGEGVGVLLLKPLDRAQRCGDPIHGLIRASVENHGGRANSPAAPNPVAQRDLLVDAYCRAQIDPATIGYIEAHGTGTALGDPIEIDGLVRAFSHLYERHGRVLPGRSHCGVGSVKSNIGHLEAAAGISGVIKTLLMFRHGKLPGNPHLKEQNPYLKLQNSPFYLVRETAHWEPLLDEEGQPIPRRAGVSSFGIGGSNAHVVLEEYRDITPCAAQPAEAYAIVLSAKNSKALKVQAENILLYLNGREQAGEINLASLAYTLQLGREPMSDRLGLVVSGINDLKNKLARFIGGEIELEGVFLGTEKRSGHSLLVLFEDEDIDAIVGKWLNKGEYQKVLRLWVSGHPVNWELLYPDGKPPRLRLPAYPFTRTRYWILKKENRPAPGTSSRTGLEPQQPGRATSTTESIVSTLAEELQVDRHTITAGITFSELGLNSITAHLWVKRLNQSLDLALDAGVIHRFKTAAELAQYISGLEGGPATEKHSAQSAAVNNARYLSLSKDLSPYCDAAFEGCENFKVEMVTLRSGIRIETFSAGRGAPLVLMPPLGCLATAWMYQFRQLSSRYRLIVCHYPGHGLSDFDNVDISFESIARYTFDTVAELRIAEPFHLAGWSMGGMVAQVMALNQPDKIASLVLVNTAAKCWERRASFTQQNTDTAVAGMIEELSSGLAKTVEEYFHNDYDFIKACYRPEVLGKYGGQMQSFNCKEKISAIDKKTLIVSGKNDRIIPSECSEFIAGGISGAVWKQHKNAGHYLPLTHSGWFNLTLKKFFDSI